jgi:hypothetical protein
MNGGSFDPSTSTGTSLRGKDAFTTPSAVSVLVPVAAATAFSSIGGAVGAAVVVVVAEGVAFVLVAGVFVLAPPQPRTTRDDRTMERIIIIIMPTI